MLSIAWVLDDSSEVVFSNIRSIFLIQEGILILLTPVVVNHSLLNNHTHILIIKLLIYIKYMFVYKNILILIQSYLYYAIMCVKCNEARESDKKS